jgi:hypothetical protein
MPRILPVSTWLSRDSTSLIPRQSHHHHRRYVSRSIFSHTRTGSHFAAQDRIFFTMTVCALWSGERTSAHRGMRFRRTRRDAEDVFRQVVPPHAAASSARFHAAPRWPALRDASEPTPSAPPRPHPHSGTPALPPRSSIRACRRPGRALSGTARRRGVAPDRPCGGSEAADDILPSSSGLHPCMPAAPHRSGRALPGPARPGALPRLGPVAAARRRTTSSFPRRASTLPIRPSFAGPGSARGFAPARPGGGGEAADDILPSSSGLHPAMPAASHR